MCFVDLEARERQADTVKTEEVKITRTLEEEVRACWMCVCVCVSTQRMTLFSSKTPRLVTMCLEVPC